MILYHGTNIEIDKIDLNKCRQFKDFGKGFYTTELYEQAVKIQTMELNMIWRCKNSFLLKHLKN